MSEYLPFILSFKLATITTTIVTTLALLFAYMIYNLKNRYVALLINMFTSIPLILPPTVLGFYILLLFGKDSIIGELFSRFGLSLLFNFFGMTFALTLSLLPQALYTLTKSIQHIDKTLINTAILLEKNRLKILLFVVIPTIKRSIYSSTIITFTSAMGSFGVLLFVGGNIKGETDVASISIYNSVLELDYTKANKLSLILLSISVLAIIVINIIERKNVKN